MPRRIFCALLTTMLLWLPPASAFAQDEAGMDDEFIEESDDEPRVLTSASDTVGDYIPTGLNGFADFWVVRPISTLVFGVGLFAYPFALIQAAASPDVTVRDVTQLLIVGPVDFLFTRKLGGSLDDRRNHRREY